MFQCYGEELFKQLVVTYHLWTGVHIQTEGWVSENELKRLLAGKHVGTPEVLQTDVGLNEPGLNLENFRDNSGGIDTAT